MTDEPGADLPDATEAIRRLEEEWERHPGVSLDAAMADVGPGWRPLVAVTWATVRSAGGRVEQTKEKFGRLRVYYDGVQPEREGEVRAQIARIVEEADRTCEWCGAPGELRDKEYAEALPVEAVLRRLWWYKTLCDEHAWRFYVDSERWWYPPGWKEDWDG